MELFRCVNPPWIRFRLWAGPGYPHELARRSKGEAVAEKMGASRRKTSRRALGGAVPGQDGHRIQDGSTQRTRYAHKRDAGRSASARAAPLPAALLRPVSAGASAGRISSRLKPGRPAIGPKLRREDMASHLKTRTIRPMSQMQGMAWFGPALCPRCKEWYAPKPPARRPRGTA